MSPGQRSDNCCCTKTNQAVVAILKAIVSALWPMMAKLRKLYAVLRAWVIRIEARWIPSAVNLFADALSRTWDPGEVSATCKVVESIAREYRVDEMVCQSPPMGETMTEHGFFFATQIAKYWG